MHLNSELVIDGQRDLFLIRRRLKWRAPDVCCLLEHGLAFEEACELVTLCWPRELLSSVLLSPSQNMGNSSVPEDIDSTLRTSRNWFHFFHFCWEIIIIISHLMNNSDTPHCARWLTHFISFTSHHNFIMSILETRKSRHEDILKTIHANPVREPVVKLSLLGFKSHIPCLPLWEVKACNLL